MARYMTATPNRRGLPVSSVLVWMLVWPSLSTATTATPSAIKTPPPPPTVAQPTLTATPTPSRTQTQLSFEFSADPPHPRLGEQVTLTFYIGRTDTAGLPRFYLTGTEPFLIGALEEVSPYGALPSQVSYHGQAVAAGRATLQLYVTYEGRICLGNNCVFSPLSATSQPFTLDISAETPLPTPTPLPACTDCATPGEPCTLSFGATGEITDRVTMQPIPSAAVLTDGGSAPYVLPNGLYEIAATRTETCNVDYAFSMRVVAPGYHVAVQNGFFPAQAFPLHVDVELDRVVGELPRIRVSPYSFTAGCMQTFQITVESSGPVGSTLELAGLALRHVPIGSFLGSGFAWDTTTVTLPASLASGQVIEIPVTFNAAGQEFGSRLELRVDSNAVNDPHVIGVYFGSSEGTCAPSVTPTPTPTNMSGSMTPTPATTASPLACVGDCDGMHKVVVTNLITLVNMALGSADISGCEAGDANGDRVITIDEILLAVSHALSGCPE
jgi:hypothetical protein